MFALILLVMVGCACAQPVFGPWVVHEGEARIEDLEVCVRGDTADVVWIEGQEVLLARLLLNGTVLGQARVLHSANSLSNPDLIDAQSFGLDRSVCLLAQSTSSGFGGTSQLLLMAYGLDDQQVQGLISASYGILPPYYAWGWTIHGYSMRSAGAELLVGLWTGSVTIYDVWYNAYVIRLDSTLAQTDYSLSIESPWPGSSAVYCFPLVGDSALLAVETLEGSLSGNYCSLSLEPESMGIACGSLASEDCGDPTNVGLLRRHLLMGVYSDGTIRSTDLSDSAHILREILPAVLPQGWTPATNFHPAYGFAAINVNPGSIMLARIDTAGNAVQPVGMLYGTDGPPFVEDADVTITDDGKVVCVWSEYDDWNNGPRVLKMAWVNWHTFLDASEHGSPAVPRELSLAAYPNPFNSTVTIRYELPQAGDVTLTIFDLQGRLIETLYAGPGSAGSHSLNWSPENLASGVYFTRLETDKLSTSAKLLFLK